MFLDPKNRNEGTRSGTRVPSRKIGGAASTYQSKNLGPVLSLCCREGTNAACLRTQIVFGCVFFTYSLFFVLTVVFLLPEGEP